MTIHIPTTLSDKKVTEFNEIYERLYGEPLPEDEARETALELLRFVGIIIREHPKFHLDDQVRS